MSIALLAHFAIDPAQAATAPGQVKDAPHSPQTPTNWPVQTCDDTTVPGSLRYIAVHAVSGDTIDFSGLPAACGMTDSTITLTAGEIVLHQPQITLIGPPPGQGTVTLSGAGQSRVLRHQVYAPFQGNLQINDLRIVDGHAYATASIGGGCVYSDANILLNRSLVDGCAAHSEMGSANGGGLNAPNGDISIWYSKVSGNTVSVGANGIAQGGGLFSISLTSKYSEIVGNSAKGDVSPAGQGGGALFNTATITRSTVADNVSDVWGGGIFAWGTVELTISNSTFSGNHAHARGGAILARPDHLFIYNTTIASNSTDDADSGGLYFDGTDATIQSTIIAGNTSSGMNGTDFYLKGGMLSGADNMVLSSNVNPSGWIVGDPKLAPLTWTGGPTRTMNLLPGSPAIGNGNNVGGWASDQRGPGFSRTTGPAATVDIGAVQADTIFASDLDRFFF